MRTSYPTGSRRDSSAPAQPLPTIAQCLNGGLSWLEVECNRCKTRASLPLADIRQPRDTPIWKLEVALKCRSCKKGRCGAAGAHDQTDRKARDRALRLIPLGTVACFEYPFWGLARFDP
jgi:hypothetical protein